MSTSIFMQISSGLHNKPGPNSKYLPFNPILDVSFSRKKINPSCVACNIGLGLRADQPKSSKTSRRNFVVYSNADPGNPLPPEAPSGDWKKWVVGIVISVILPLFSSKLGPWGAIKNNFFTTLQKVENVVECFENVSKGVAKAAKDATDGLPDGQLKSAVKKVGCIAWKAYKDADALDNIIDKIQEEEEKIEQYRIEEAKEKAKESIKDQK